MTHKYKRLAELNNIEIRIMNRIHDCKQNIIALERMILKEEKEITTLFAQRKEFEIELLELKAEHDYNNDIKMESQ